MSFLRNINSIESKRDSSNFPQLAFVLIEISKGFGRIKTMNKFKIARLKHLYINSYIKLIEM